MTPSRHDYAPLLIAAAGLLALPSLMHAIGLGTTSATEIVVVAIACMALNILVGTTGLVSFGHGAWFGLAAYAAGLMQRNWFPGQFALPILLAVAFVALIAFAFGALILAPAIGSFGRTWEKVTAILVSVFVLVALLAIGVAVGVAIVYYWDDITNIFS